jgi:hypothetical protein
MILDRLPALNSPAGSAIRRVAATALAVFGLGTILLVMYRGDPPVTSPEILRQVHGCYYLEGRLALVLSADGMAHVSGPPVRYEVHSSKGQFRILPARRLVMARGPDGLRGVHIANALPLFLPVRLGPYPAIDIDTFDSNGASLQKAPCHGRWITEVH